MGVISVDKVENLGLKNILLAVPTFDVSSVEANPHNDYFTALHKRYRRQTII